MVLALLCLLVSVMVVTVPGAAAAGNESLQLTPGASLLFIGHGAGHGVGMSQWGARGRALAGQTTAQILSAYYSGATLTPGTDDGQPIRVLLPSKAIETLSLRDYLASVVSSELPPGFPPAAVEAQAIASRTYALWLLNPAKPYDVTSTVSTQAFGATARPDAVSAVAATSGVTLTNDGHVIPAYFHSCSPYRTDNVEDVWPGPALPSLRGIEDRDATGQPYAVDCPRLTWQAGPFTNESLSAALAKDPRTSVGTLTAITFGPLTPGGRWQSLTLQGDGGVKTVTLPVFRAIVNSNASSGHRLYSADFQIVVEPSPTAGPLMPPFFDVVL